MYDTATKLVQGSLTRGSHPTRTKGNQKFFHLSFFSSIGAEKSFKILHKFQNLLISKSKQNCPGSCVF